MLLAWLLCTFCASTSAQLFGNVIGALDDGCPVPQFNFQVLYPVIPFATYRRPFIGNSQATYEVACSGDLNCVGCFLEAQRFSGDDFLGRVSECFDKYELPMAYMPCSEIAQGENKTIKFNDLFSYVVPRVEVCRDIVVIRCLSLASEIFRQTKCINDILTEDGSSFDKMTPLDYLKAELLCNQPLPPRTILQTPLTFPGGNGNDGNGGDGNDDDNSENLETL